MALASADTYVVVVALPDMMAGVGLGIDDLHRATPIISGFLLGYIVALPLIGRLSDLVARQKILLWCMSVFVVGSAVTAVSVELPVLVSGRVLQGIGGGGLVPATLALVADLWPPDRRGVPLGVVGATQELGAVLGPLLGAAVLAVADWRAIFWLNVAGGSVIALVLAVSAGRGNRPHLRRLPSVLALLTLGCGMLTLIAPTALASDVTLGIPFVPFAGATSRLATPIGLATTVLLLTTAAVVARPAAALLRSLDLLGAFWVAVALGSLVLMFASADPQREVVGPWGWAWGPLGLLAVAAYLRRHRTARDPLVARGLLSIRGGSPVVPALLVSTLAGVALVAIVVDIPVLARLTVTSSQTAAALLLVRFLVAVPVGALAGGWLANRHGPAVVAGGGLVMAGTGLALMSGWGAGSLDLWPVTPVLALAGLGLGLALAPVNAAALAGSPADAHGVVSSLVVLARMVGMVFGLGLLTAVGLHRYYTAVAALPDQVNVAALAGQAVVQVQTVFVGGATAAFCAAVMATSLRATPARR